MSQPIQVVDDNDVPIGVSSIDDVHQSGQYHRIVRIMVECSDGSVLLQRRVKTKQLFPNCWDNSAAGHVDAGETYEIAALRELSEEIGLRDVELEQVDYYKTIGMFHGRKLNRFNKLYRVILPTRQDFQLQKSEVAEVRWFTVDELIDLCNSHSKDVTDGLLEVKDRMYT